VADVTDETLEYEGPLSLNEVPDDEFGDLIDMIQMQSAFVSGAIDACHSNGMLDGISDIQGFVGKESVWMTSATEWEESPITCGSGGFGTLAALLLRANPGDVDQIGDLQTWFLNGAGLGHNQTTIGVKLYEDLDGSKTYFPPSVPEPSILALFGTALGVCARIVALRVGFALLFNRLAHSLADCAE
jgi:hypothetical protein